jgi:hypothetical protein
MARAVHTPAMKNHCPIATKRSPMSPTSLFAAAIFALAAVTGCTRHRGPEHPAGSPPPGHGPMAEGHGHGHHAPPGDCPCRHHSEDGGIACPMMHAEDGGVMAPMPPGPDGGLDCPMHGHGHGHEHEHAH